MRRLLLLSATLSAAATLACSRGHAAAPASPPMGTAEAAPAVPLFRDVAGAPAVPEVQVPVTSLAPLIERLRPSVVNISTTTELKHPPVRRAPPPPRQPRGGGDDFDEFFERFFGGPPGPRSEAPDELRGASLGSGFLLSTEGYVLTNNHVVKGATEIRVRLSDGREFSARVVGRDTPTDVALIQLQDAPKDLPPPVVLGDSDVLRQGDFVLAMGSPFGLRDTATLGIVSAKHRGGIGNNATYDDFIQTDAAINPGNSGGPLFNLRGEVVGINTAIVSPQLGQGIGFAVPISLAKALLPQLRANGKVTRGYVGLQLSDLTPDLAQGFNLKPGTKGALVQAVVPRSPADKAGLKAGDVVTQLNGKPVDSMGALTRAVALVAPGQSATVLVTRGDGQKQFTLKVTKRPEDEAAVGQGEAPTDEESVEPAVREQGVKLGVGNLTLLTPELAGQLGLEPGAGVVVGSVLPGGPADRASLRRGDVILEIDRQPMRRIEDLKAALGKKKDGELALLRVQRGDRASYLTVKVGGVTVKQP
jgi:serine protease Do